MPRGVIVCAKEYIWSKLFSLYPVVKITAYLYKKGYIYHRLKRLQSPYIYI